MTDYSANLYESRYIYLDRDYPNLGTINWPDIVGVINNVVKNVANLIVTLIDVGQQIKLKIEYWKIDVEVLRAKKISQAKREVAYVQLQEDLELSNIEIIRVYTKGMEALRLIPKYEAEMEKIQKMIKGTELKKLHKIKATELLIKVLKMAGIEGITSDENGNLIY